MIVYPLIGLNHSQQILSICKNYENFFGVFYEFPKYYVSCLASQMLKYNTLIWKKIYLKTFIRKKWYFTVPSKFYEFPSLT